LTILNNHRAPGGDRVAEKKKIKEREFSVDMSKERRKDDARNRNIACQSKGVVKPKTDLKIKQRRNRRE
jgi:hypothetical protein